MNADRYDEAVLLIGFNRPDLLSEVIDRVRRVAPTRVYLAVDGPRSDREGEADRVAACQALAGTIDWECDVHTLFREQNLGCGLGVSGAISWFFEHEERGIILEDDILADPSFFGFASELLDRYADDERVFAITGTNFVPPEHMTDTSTYRFSRVPVVWGWATWRRVWQTYNFDMMARHAVDTWDLQLVFASMAAGRYTATPPVNLVENVGFRADATHTLRTPDYLRSVESIAVPTSPAPVELDERADRWLMRHVYGASLPGLAGQAGRGIKQLARKR